MGRYRRTGLGALAPGQVSPDATGIVPAGQEGAGAILWTFGNAPYRELWGSNGVRYQLGVDS